MRAGVLQQVGPPSELYGHPNNLFVAGFIGSPSMNFLAGEISGDNVHLPIGDVRIPDELRRRLESGPAAAARGVIAGLRPEHFEDAGLVADRSTRGHVQGQDRRARVDGLGVLRLLRGRVRGRCPRVSSRSWRPTRAARTCRAPGWHPGHRATGRREPSAGRAPRPSCGSTPTHLQLFDPESGRSLLATGGAPTSTQASTSTQAPAATPPQAPPAS